jgi:hypothetical protein
MQMYSGTRKRMQKVRVTIWEHAPAYHIGRRVDLTRKIGGCNYYVFPGENLGVKIEVESIPAVFCSIVMTKPMVHSGLSPGSSPDNSDQCDDQRGVSPRKSPKLVPRLPPLSGEPLNISKRRRLEPMSSPIRGGSNRSTAISPTTITPSKLRSFSSPQKQSAKRTPSLQDRPIPVLSPPLPASVTQDPSPNGLLLTSDKISSSPPEFIRSNRSVTSPVQSIPDRQMLNLQGKEQQMDREINNLKKIIEIADQAYKYENSSRDRKLDELHDMWRIAAQEAAIYLFNQAKERVSAMGGMSELKRRQQKQREFSSPFFGSEEFDLKSLSNDQREIYEQLKKEYDDRLAKTNDNSDDGTEFTMEYMLTTLSIKYDVLFPEGFN